MKLQTKVSQAQRRHGKSSFSLRDPSLPASADDMGRYSCQTCWSWYHCRVSTPFYQWYQPCPPAEAYPPQRTLASQDTATIDTKAIIQSESDYYGACCSATVQRDNEEPEGSSLRYAEVCAEVEG